MKANEGKYEDVARMCLEQLGATVRPVDRDPVQRRYDFLAMVGDEKIAIEVKDKFDDQRLSLLRRETLAKNETYEEQRALGYNTAIAGKAKAARRQLEGHIGATSDFQVIWFNVSGRAIEAKLSQIKATMFGTQKIMGLDFAQIRTCYFFGESTFYSHRDVLDGAVAAAIQRDQVSFSLLINSASPRYQSFVASKFARMFGSAIIDPLIEEREEHFILGPDADRSNEGTKLNYLSKKYAAGPIQTFDMGHISAEMLIPEDYD